MMRKIITTKDHFTQQLIKGLTNVFFSAFIIGILIFTVVSIRYQPPDPWLEPLPGQAITQLLNSVQNATFVPDDSVLPTGEDFALPDSGNADKSSQEAVPAIITEATIDEAEKAIKEHLNSTCNPLDKVINCSDPGALGAVVSYNLHHFKDLNFFSYGTPVRGQEESECDVAWRYRPKKEKSWRMYRDYRRFSLIVDEDCNYSVVDASGWHSGKNAKAAMKKDKLFRAKSEDKAGHESEKEATHHNAENVNDHNGSVIEQVLDGGSSSSNNEMISEEAVVDATPVEQMNAETKSETPVVEEDGSVVMEVVPTANQGNSEFNSKKYLFYAKGGDHCKKMNHYLWSFLCALGEAVYLNRTFVVDMNICLSGSYNPERGDEDGKNLQFYIDVDHLKEVASVVEQEEFLKNWREWDDQHKDWGRASFKEVSDYKVSPMELASDDNTIIMRKFNGQEPENYWYRVCEGEAEQVIQRPWHMIWKSKAIMEVVNGICGEMEWDFDVVHVERGEKIYQTEKWPKLNEDTQAWVIAEKLKNEGQMDTERRLYIATNERESRFFDPLKKVFPRARTIDDYSYLWAPNSFWYNYTIVITNGNPTEFDSFMRAEVDTEVALRAKNRFETFGFLTSDCKDGANTC